MNVGSNSLVIYTTAQRKSVKIELEEDYHRLEWEVCL